MRLLSAFLNILRIDTTPAPKPAEPPVPAEALLDLALVMRGLWWSDCGFARDADKGLVCAALARIFPAKVQTAERCKVCDPADQAGCDECATEADLARFDARLTAFLSSHDRPRIADDPKEASPFIDTLATAVATDLPHTYFGVYGENGKRWHVAGEGFEMKPEGSLSATQAYAMCVIAAHALNRAADQTP